jgi:hypothetical protein
VDTAPRDRTNSAVARGYRLETSWGVAPRRVAIGRILAGTQRAVGTVLNGTVLNGTVLNGTVLNGTAAFGVFLWLEVLDFDRFFCFILFLHD